MTSKKWLALSTIGPGILVAATGVGAGDLATATLAGNALGTGVLWAVLVGASMKFLLNEGLARWQLATGTTLLEGCFQHLGAPARWIFMVYMTIWSYLLGMALMSACGVTMHAMLPIYSDLTSAKIIFGTLHSAVAVGLILLGGYRLFEKIMSICAGIMFGVICATMIVLRPDYSEVLTGMFIPTIPKIGEGGLAWTIAILGGIGGTVTMLCYGYWIREEGRTSAADLPLCRIDLGIGYLMTAIFGLGMIIIGSRLGHVEGAGATLIVQVADMLRNDLGAVGPAARWAFLIGAWGAVFSSLLGVWQSVPYLFVDCWRMINRPQKSTASTSSNCTASTNWLHSPAYRYHLLAIAIVPITGLFFFDFKSAMKVNGIVGALFIPMLGIVLLLLNGNAQLIGHSQRNSWIITFLLMATLVLFLAAGGFEIADNLR